MTPVRNCADAKKRIYTLPGTAASDLRVVNEGKWTKKLFSVGLDWRFAHLV